MALADVDLVVKLALEKLQASPRHARYTLAVGNNSAYPVLQELKDICLMVDEALILDIISAKEGHPWANKFMTLSGALLSGAKITEHVGIYGDVLVALDGLNFAPSEPAKSRSDILQMIALPDLYGGPSRHHWIENNFIYHAGVANPTPGVKVYYPVFTKTSACQSPQQYEDVLLYGTVAMAEKLPAGNPFFTRYNGLYLATRQMAVGGADYIPSQQRLEAMIGRAA